MNWRGIGNASEYIAPLVRELEAKVKDTEIIAYQPFVVEIKEVIQKKQYRALKLINTETIELYWEIGEEIHG